MPGNATFGKVFYLALGHVSSGYPFSVGYLFFKFTMNCVGLVVADHVLSCGLTRWFLPRVVWGSTIGLDFTLPLGLFV